MSDSTGQLKRIADALERIALAFEGPLPAVVGRPDPAVLGQEMTHRLGFGVRERKAVGRAWEKKFPNDPQDAYSLPLSCVVELSAGELLDVRHCGVTTVNQIRASLAAFGLKLRGDP